MHDDHGNGRAGEALLILEVTVDGQQDVELLSGATQQLAVLDASPSAFRYRPDIVPRKMVPQRSRDALVKQHAHWR